ncbi:MAG: hypothetical protein LKF47_01695 [Megasphaera sp.]|jgi:hypothetical protein|nr:hypothetical protein [Megasphaera sp.]MCI1248477.1 hypothetical protein [Megasphaera sp.]
MALFKVAAHTGENNNGYISYDTDTKALDVHLNDDSINTKVRTYLTSVQSMHRFTDLSLYDTINAIPASSLETLKLALGYIWLAMGVHIDWSRPVDMA